MSILRKIPKHYLETFKKIYPILIFYITIPLFLLYTAASYVFNIDIKLKETEQLILLVTILLGTFIHGLFIYFFSKQPTAYASLSPKMNFNIYSNLFKHAENEFLTTHIYAFDTESDYAYNALKKINEDIGKTKRGSFTFHRIIGIITESDVDFAEKSLLLKKEFKNVRIFITILDLTSDHEIGVLPNIIVRDMQDALIAFPLREEGTSRGIFVSDPEICSKVLSLYWDFLQSSEDLVISPTPKALKKVRKKLRTKNGN